MENLTPNRHPCSNKKRSFETCWKDLSQKNTLKKYNFNDFFSYYYQNLPVFTKQVPLKRLIFPWGFWLQKTLKFLAAAKGPTLFLLQQPGKPFSLIPSRSEWMLKKSAKRKTRFVARLRGGKSGRFFNKYVTQNRIEINLTPFKNNMKLNTNLLFLEFFSWSSSKIIRLSETTSFLGGKLTRGPPKSVTWMFTFGVSGNLLPKINLRLRLSSYPACYRSISKLPRLFPYSVDGYPGTTDGAVASHPNKKTENWTECFNRFNIFNTKTLCMDIIYIYMSTMISYPLYHVLYPIIISRVRVNLQNKKNNLKTQAAWRPWLKKKLPQTPGVSQKVTESAGRPGLWQYCNQLRHTRWRHN